MLFCWDSDERGNVEHIAEHGLTTEDVEHAFENVTDYLTSRGVSLTGWSSLTYCFGVSDDNSIFAGNGVYNGTPAVWIATVPSPPTLLVVSGLLPLALRRRR